MTGEPLPTFRDLVYAVSPPWLRRHYGVRVLYACAVIADALADALVAGVKLRFPRVYSDESLPQLGRERRIRRGRLETADKYATRLRRWLEDHQVRGGPRALLSQLRAFFADAPFEVHLVYASGARYRLDAQGNITRDVVSGQVKTDPQWARWWLFYITDSFTPPLTAADVDELALIPREWIAAHCEGEIITFVSGGELWNYPDGHTWNETGTWNTTPVQRIKV